MSAPEVERDKIVTVMAGRSDDGLQLAVNDTLEASLVICGDGLTHTDLVLVEYNDCLLAERAQGW